MKRTMRNRMILAFLFSSRALLQAQGPGSSGAEFLRLGAGAGAAGLGDAYGARATGSEAMFWNVAGLAKMTNSSQLTFTHAPLFGLLRHDSAGLAFRLPQGKAAAGLAFTRLSQPPLEGRDNRGENTGDFQVADQALGLGLATALGSLSVGVLVNAVESRIGKQTAQTALLDLGLRQSWRRLELGLAVRHLGPGLSYGASKEPAPTTIESAVAVKLLNGVTLALQFDYGARQRKAGFGMGTEYALASVGGTRMSLRGGLKPDMELRQPLSALRGGFGVESRRLSLDYAVLPMSQMKSGHRFTVGLKF